MNTVQTRGGGGADDGIDLDGGGGGAGRRNERPRRGREECPALTKQQSRREKRLHLNNIIMLQKEMRELCFMVTKTKKSGLIFFILLCRRPAEAAALACWPEVAVLRRNRYLRAKTKPQHPDTHLERR